jgi:hypothetical protein
MTFSERYDEPHFMRRRWAIKSTRSGLLLGYRQNPTPADNPATGASFDATVPLMFSKRGSARDTWVRWLVAHKFIKRGITLPKPLEKGLTHPKVRVTYDVLINPPEVCFVRLHLLEERTSPFILNAEPDGEGGEG